MTVDYHKLNQIVGPTVADMPNMVSWWEKINSASGIQSWSSKNIFFILFKRNDQKQFTFMWDKQENTFNIVLQGYVNSSALINSEGAWTIWTFHRRQKWSTILMTLS